jgi:asparagine synthase (glutamine-hydrolysing)
MCGIAGFCDWEEAFDQDVERWTEVLVRMRTAIAHRGCDQTGEYLRRHVGLAHTRLSIRDLSGGLQPMVRRQDGAEYAIVYNGEIYNAEELKGELQARGWTFETTCDTEVILCGYMEYGMEVAKKLNGIFAFAIWDGRQETLFLCRDRLGVKPLFYAPRGTELVFGSEPKALFAHPDIRPQADLDSFREIFGLGPARTPGCGVFRGVREVKPGHILAYSQAGMEEYPYWTLEAKPHTDSYAQTVETVSWLLRDAVKRQLVSDVPVCSFLSGGIDSSVVTAIACRQLEAQGHSLNTFSFDFAHNDDCFRANAFQPTRDRPYVDQVLALYPLHHTYLECDEATLADLLPAAVRMKDLPGMTDVDASLLYFCGLVKQHNKVALTGECADEIFGGYPWFYREELLNTDGFPWSPDLSARTALLSEEAIRTLELEDYVREQYRDTLARVPALPEERGEVLRRREISFLNLRWFMQTLLDRMDRTSMAWGLEARVPFVDHRIVEYVYNVPWEMKYQEGMEKKLLRDACRDLLPPELLYRKKSPYPKTYSPVYEALLTERFRRVLADPQAPVQRFLDREKAERFLAQPKDYGRPWFGQLMAGPQMIAYFLQINDWMVRYGIE